MSQYRKRTNTGEQKERGPFTSQSQIYITASQSDKNKGKYYYGFDGSWLKWVDSAKLGTFLTTLQTDGKKWYFAPGHIDPELQDVIQRVDSPPMQPVGYQPSPQPPPPITNAPPYQNVFAAGNVPKPPSDNLTALVPLLTTLNDHLSDLGEYINALVQQLKELNANKKVSHSIKRQKMLSEATNLEHEVPGQFADEPDGHDDDDDTE